MKKEETTLSKHNYSKYSSKSSKPHVDNAELKPIVNPIDETTSYVEPVSIPEVKLAEEAVSTVMLPTMVEGVVVDCARLNVRANPTTDADIVCVLDVHSEIEIDVNKSTDEWFYICTAAGMEGYCMRKFVNARL